MGTVGRIMRPPSELTVNCPRVAHGVGARQLAFSGSGAWSHGASPLHPHFTSWPGLGVQAARATPGLAFAIALISPPAMHAPGPAILGSKFNYALQVLCGAGINTKKPANC